MASYVSPKLKVGKSPIEGRGLFAVERIRKGESVLDFTNGPGKVMSREAVETLRHKYDEYDFQVDHDVILVKNSKEDLEAGDFINHSCDPNCGVRGTFQFVCMRDVEPGEEVTYDYAMTDSYASEMKCDCEAKDCRKLITGNDWKLQELQERYKGFFSRYLQEEMSRQGSQAVFRLDFSGVSSIIKDTCKQLLSPLANRKDSGR